MPNDWIKRVADPDMSGAGKLGINVSRGSGRAMVVWVGLVDFNIPLSSDKYIGRYIHLHDVDCSFLGLFTF